jgi:serine/threonine protein kinase
MDKVSMVGGRMIGRGNYGCIFDPPLLCRGDKAPKGGMKKGKLGKLTAMTDIKSEFLAATRFRNKPEARKYFILPEIQTLCKEGIHGEPSINIDSQKEPDLGKCNDIIKEEGIENMLHYQLEYGGKTLQDKMENIQLAVKEFPFFKFMGNILEIGAYLVLNGLVHNDLHSANILLNKEYYPRLIDFGRCYAANEITKDVLDNLAADYRPSGGPENVELGQITPECSTQDGLSQGYAFEIIVEDLYNKKPGLLYAERLFGQSRQQQLNEFQSFWKTSKCVNQKDFVKFWNLYWPTVDAWAIGHCLASILKKFSMSNTFMTAPAWKKKFSIIKTVITGLLRASPRNRIDCVEALAIYDPMNAVVLSPSGKAWLMKKQARKDGLIAKARTI